MAHVNLPLSELRPRKDFHSRVCLEYYRGKKWSEFVAVEASGLVKDRELTRTFEQRFKYDLGIPLERAALSFLKAQKTAHTHNTHVTEILLEVYIMAKTNATNLSTLDTKALVAVYNDIAKAAGKPELKAFKESKAKLIKKIEDLRAEVAKPTKKQAEVGILQQALNDLKKPKAERAPKAKPEPKAAKPKAAPAVKEKSTKPRGQGIGAFCVELIRAGKTNAEVLAAVKKQFPAAATSPASIAWYRNKLKDE